MKNSTKIIRVESESVTANGVAFTSGVFTGGGLILYFILMRLLNLHQNVLLHYLNIAVLFLGLRYAIKKIAASNGQIKYFEGLKAGVTVSLLSVILLNIFLVIYVIALDPPFLDMLREYLPLQHSFSKQELIFNLVGIISIEGLSSGFILTFILMQYYKSNKSETI